MTETGKVFLHYLYKRFWWKVIHHRKKLFRIIHKKTARRTLMSMRYNRIISYGRGALPKLIEKSTEVKFNESNAC